MHGTGIPFIDMGACSIKMNDDGSFNMLVGATDLGTGADTVLAQIAAEVLGSRRRRHHRVRRRHRHHAVRRGRLRVEHHLHLRHGGEAAAEAARERIATARRPDAGASTSRADIELRDRRAWAPDGRSVSLADVALHMLHTR